MGAFGGAAVLAGAAVTGRVSRRSGGLLVLRDWLDAPGVFGALIVVLLIVALVFSHWPVWVRGMFGMGVLTLGVLAMPFLLLGTFLASDPTTLSTEPAPGRPDHRLVVQVQTQGLGPDPYYTVFLDHGSGPATRRWDVACIDGDADGITEAVWVGPDQLRLVTDRETHLIRVADDGRPSRSLC